jgi:hypothetical protein
MCIGTVETQMERLLLMMLHDLRSKKSYQKLDHKNFFLLHFNAVMFI